ncbi:MAG: hypothetical protein Q4D45_02700 [Lachnospiraceae bacterium]|nr:hypothetical protein [Lachnospiraceae bacterium]
MEYTNDHKHVYGNISLQAMKNRIVDIQNNAEVSVRYMQEWEERILEQQEAIENEYLDLIRKKLEKGQSIKQIAEILEIDVDEIEKLIKKLK